MATTVILDTRRSHYGAEDAAARSITVAELIEFLGQFDGDSKIVTSHDNGYTYGYIKDYDLFENEVEG